VKNLLVVLGVLTILAMFWDAFETLILPRRVSRRIRLARLFFRATWRVWRWAAAVLRGERRENYLSYYGPLSLLLLLAVWAAGLILGFALLQLGIGRVHPASDHNLGSLLYLSASTFFTLGLGDITPANSFSRAVMAIESGAGLAFLALVIAYLPVLYQAFARRETRISMLDERAGSPPTAGALLGRYGSQYGETEPHWIRDWELWAAELLESHLSYPVLAYFRSQHDNQSWVAGLTVILDATALVLTGIDGLPSRQAGLTFAMARHAAVDLARIFSTNPRAPAEDRLPAEELQRLRGWLEERDVDLLPGDAADAELTRLRQSYEPYVNALSQFLRMPLPGWMPPQEARDNWEVTAWEPRPATSLWSRRQRPKL
jgi:hypothetical protein